MALTIIFSFIIFVIVFIMGASIKLRIYKMYEDDEKLFCIIGLAIVNIFTVGTGFWFYHFIFGA